MKKNLRAPATVPAATTAPATPWKAWLLYVSIRALAAICAVAVFTTVAKAFEAKPPSAATQERVGASVLQLLGAENHANRMPEIVLVNPRLPIQVSSPFDIELQFLAAPPAKIVRTSLRVLYGFFGFDITERLTENAEVTEFGVLAKNANLPSGSHNITIEIADDHDRITRKTFQFEIRDQ